MSWTDFWSRLADAYRNTPDAVVVALVALFGTASVAAIGAVIARKPYRRLTALGELYDKVEDPEVREIIRAKLSVGLYRWWAIFGGAIIFGLLGWGIWAAERAIDQGVSPEAGWQVLIGACAVSGAAGACAAIWLLPLVRQWWAGERAIFARTLDQEAAALQSQMEHTQQRLDDTNRQLRKLRPVDDHDPDLGAPGPAPQRRTPGARPAQRAALIQNRRIQQINERSTCPPAQGGPGHLAAPLVVGLRSSMIVPTSLSE